MICIPVTASTAAAALRQMKEAEALADVIELRVDLIGEAAMAVLLEARERPVIVTNRRRQEGGAFAGTEAERIAVLAAAVRLGAEYVDVETATDPALKEELHAALRGSSTRLIASWHDFSGTPDSEVLQERFAACLADDPRIVKIVTLARTPGDCLRVLALIPQGIEKGRAVTAFCMGRDGAFSRIAAHLMGAAVTYCSVEDGAASAPGQLKAGRMKEILRLLEADRG